MQQKRTIFDAHLPRLSKFPKSSLSEALGHAQQQQTHASPTSNDSKLAGLVKRSQRILYRANSVFPFDVFPDTVIVDENKIDLVLRKFIFNEEIYTILIRNITMVNVYHNLLFATLSVEVTGFEQKPPEVTYLWKRDAVRVRNIVLGLLACAKENIDTSVYNANEIAKKVEAIGLNSIEQRTFG